MKRLDREFILKAVKNTEGKGQGAMKITGQKDAEEYARKFYSDDLVIYESAFIILLNRQHNTIGWAKIGQGGIAGTVVDIKLVCKYAIDALASGVIFVHNHPSGNLKPSPQDDQLTHKMKEALKYLDINLLDSIILTENDSYSYLSEGRL